MNRQYEDWENTLAPRLILGLWHPLFLKATYNYLPKLKRYHIGFSIAISKQFFWEACDGFSLRFSILMGAEGQKFMRECEEAGKEVCVWTVNDPREMRVAISWGVKAVLTDRVGSFVQVKKEVSNANVDRNFELRGTRSWRIQRSSSYLDGAGTPFRGVLGNITRWYT